MHRKPASKKAQKISKIKAHLACISLGTLLSIGLTFVSPSLVHVAVILPALPSVAQEIIDRIFGF